MVFTNGCCGHCGEQFRYPREYGVVRYCSANCRVAVEPPEQPWEYKGCRSSRYYSKRRRHQIDSGDRIDPLVVYLHYDWTCHLCCGKIDPTIRVPDPMSASIDHITSLESGGLHEWNNVAPAHKQCNEEKSYSEKESVTRDNELISVGVHR